MLNERTDLALEMHEIKCERNINDGIIVDEEYDDRIKMLENSKEYLYRIIEYKMDKK